MLHIIAIGGYGICSNRRLSIEKIGVGTLLCYADVVSHTLVVCVITSCKIILTGSLIASFYEKEACVHLEATLILQIVSYIFCQLCR